MHRISISLVILTAICQSHYLIAGSGKSISSNLIAGSGKSISSSSAFVSQSISNPIVLAEDLVVPRMPLSNSTKDFIDINGQEIEIVTAFDKTFDQRFTITSRDNVNLKLNGIKSVLGWKSRTVHGSGKHAILFLSGNGYGFEYSVNVANALPNAFESNDMESYTVSYLGQGSEGGVERTERKQTIVVQEMLRKMVRDGYQMDQITILAHSIGGYLGGLALSNSEFDKVGIVSLGSPNSIGATISNLIFLPFMTGYMKRKINWHGSAVDGYNRSKFRIALAAEKDSLVKYKASIAYQLEENKKGIVAGASHNSCLDIRCKMNYLSEELELNLDTKVVVNNAENTLKTVILQVVNR